MNLYVVVGASIVAVGLLAIAFGAGLEVSRWQMRRLGFYRGQPGKIPVRTSPPTTILVGWMLLGAAVGAAVTGLTAILAAALR